MNDDTWSDNETLFAAGRRAFQEIPDAPAAAIRQAEAIWRKSPGLLNRIQAYLAVDSWSTPLPAMRSGAVEQRQLLFSTESRDIDVRLTRTDAGWTLEGQVLGPCDSASLCIQGAGAEPLWVVLDELGAFHAPTMRDGCYDLVLYIEADRVELAQIELKPQDGG